MRGEDGEEITAQNGRYGPYLKKGTDSRSLTHEDQIFDITLDQALAIYAQPKQRGRGAAAPPLKELGNDPVSGQPVVVKAGRFGEYVTDGEYNATLRKDDTVESITLERAAELLQERRDKGPAKKAAKKGAKKAPAKKAAKKTAAKKTTVKKATAKKAPRRRRRQPRRPDMSTPAPGTVAVVGGGIVGLAVARELTRRWPGVKVVVLEKEDRVGAHQTGHNSGVVHAGIYYKPGSLKAELCTRGRLLLKEFCAERDLPYDECGKLVVAVDPRRAGPVRGAGDDRAGQWRRPA